MVPEVLLFGLFVPVPTSHLQPFFRVGHVKLGKNRRSQSLEVPMNVDSPSEGRGFPSGFHQGETGRNGPTPSDQRVLNQVYVAPSLDPEIFRQAAVEVLSANQRETEART